MVAVTTRDDSQELMMMRKRSRRSIVEDTENQSINEKTEIQRQTNERDQIDHDWTRKINESLLTIYLIDPP